jgi:DnaJ-class molecular chaperone
MAWLVIFVVVLAAGYFVSLRLHPLARCDRCKGTGRHVGSVYTYAFRRCRKCGGFGRKDRLGTRWFHGGTTNGVLTKRR